MRTFNAHFKKRNITVPCHSLTGMYAMVTDKISWHFFDDIYHAKSWYEMRTSGHKIAQPLAWYISATLDDVPDEDRLALSHLKAVLDLHEALLAKPDNSHCIIQLTDDNDPTNIETRVIRNSDWAKAHALLYFYDEVTRL